MAPIDTATILETTLLAVKQVPPVIVIVQETAAPLASVEEVKVLTALLCTGLPLTLKVYVTVPVPVLAAVAVNVMGVAAQTGPAGLAAKTTAGVKLGFTAMLMAFDDAVLAVKQVPPLTVIAQVTLFPFTSVDEVYVLAALLCTGVPST